MTTTFDRAMIKTVVHETLLAIGIDAENPLEAQSDFVAMRDMRSFLRDENNTKDLAHLRKWRIIVEQVESKGAMLVLSVLVGLGIVILLKIDPALFIKP